MKPLIKSEDFHLRNIQVSSMHNEFGDPMRVGSFNPWCTSAGNQFGEWVQVDLGKLFNSLVFNYIQSKLSKRPTLVTRTFVKPRLNFNETVHCAKAIPIKCFVNFPSPRLL